jgi:hypothetical protein
VATLVIATLLAVDTMIADRAFYRDLVRRRSFGTEFSYEAGRRVLAPLAAIGAGCDANVAGLYPDLFARGQVENTAGPFILVWQKGSLPLSLPHSLATDLYAFAGPYPFLLHVRRGAEAELDAATRARIQPVCSLAARHETQGLTLSGRDLLAGPETPDGIVVWGPYIALPAGQYDVCFDFPDIRVTGPDWVRVEASAAAGRVILASRQLPAGTGPGVQVLRFSLREPAGNVEFRVAKQGAPRFALRSIVWQPAAVSDDREPAAP